MYGPKPTNHGRIQVHNSQPLQFFKNGGVGGLEVPAGVEDRYESVGGTTSAVPLLETVR